MDHPNSDGGAPRQDSASTQPLDSSRRPRLYRAADDRTAKPNARGRRRTSPAPVPPHDVDAEEQVLGAALHGDTAALNRLAESDFYRPAHRAVCRAIRHLATHGRTVDPVAVKGILEREGDLTAVGGLPFLFHLVEGVTLLANAPTHAETVAGLSVVRQLADYGHQVTATAQEHAHDPHKAVRHATELLERLQIAADAAAGAAAGLDVFAFLAQPLPEYDWLVERLLERLDRVMLTGEEGAGKSTFLRQLAVQAAAGIHPFTLDPLPRPLRILLVDFENSPLHVRRELRPLTLKAGDQLTPGQLTITTHPEGIDLSTPEGYAWLTAEIAGVPNLDLLCIGPVYKMASGNPSDEDAVRPVQRALDALRGRYRFALILEAHVGHGSNGHGRPTRPIGSSAWLRWPEFGLNLSKAGVLTHWRGQRDERDWPSALKRGGEWPWTYETVAVERVWAQILGYADTALTKPSIRTLAAAVNANSSMVYRALQQHEKEWDRLATDLWKEQET